MEGCTVTDLKVHSQRNCYCLSPEQMRAIQDKGVSIHLEPGTNIVKLREGSFSYGYRPDGRTCGTAVDLRRQGDQQKRPTLRSGRPWASLNGFLMMLW